MRDSFLVGFSKYYPLASDHRSPSVTCQAVFRDMPCGSQKHACFSTAWGNNPYKHRVGTMDDSHRGAGTRRGLCDCLVFREGVTTRKNGSHSVVLYHSLEYPKADHLINKQMGGRAGQVPEGRETTPKPGRKKERTAEKKRDRGPSGKQSLCINIMCNFVFASWLIEHPV